MQNPNGGIYSGIKKKIAPFFLFYLMPAYVVHYYLAVDFRALFFIGIFFLFTILIVDKSSVLSRKVLHLIGLIIFLGVIGSVFSGATSQIFMSVSLSAVIVIISVWWHDLVDELVIKYLNIYCIVLLIGAFIGFVYAINGGQPNNFIKVYEAEHGRILAQYLTTFSSSMTGGMIRPDGLFDEPGAFAFFLTCVICLNEIFSVNQKYTYVLFIMGLITGSLIFFILFLLYMNFFMFKKNANKGYVLVGILLVFGLYYYLGGTEIYDSFYAQRVVVEDGRIVGDNRSNQVENFFAVVNDEIFWRGAQQNTMLVDQVGDQSSNPFSILFGYGIFMWLIYFILQVWLLFVSVFYKKVFRFPALMMFLTLLQRPYILNIYWTSLIVLVVYSIYKIQKSDYRSVPPIYYSDN
jgi:hypothetical protein